MKIPRLPSNGWWGWDPAFPESTKMWFKYWCTQQITYNIIFFKTRVSPLKTPITRRVFLITIVFLISEKWCNHSQSSQVDSAFHNCNVGKIRSSYTTEGDCCIRLHSYRVLRSFSVAGSTVWSYVQGSARHWGCANTTQAPICTQITIPIQVLLSATTSFDKVLTRCFPH